MRYVRLQRSSATFGCNVRPQRSCVTFVYSVCQQHSSTTFVHNVRPQRSSVTFISNVRLQRSSITFICNIASITFVPLSVEKSFSSRIMFSSSKNSYTAHRKPFFSFKYLVLLSERGLQSDVICMKSRNSMYLCFFVKCQHFLW